MWALQLLTEFRSCSGFCFCVVKIKQASCQLLTACKNTSSHCILLHWKFHMSTSSVRCRVFPRWWSQRSSTEIKWVAPSPYFLKCGMLFPNFLETWRENADRFMKIKSQSGCLHSRFLSSKYIKMCLRLGSAWNPMRELTAFPRHLAGFKERGKRRRGKEYGEGDKREGGRKDNKRSK